MGDTAQEQARGPLGFGKKKLESLFVFTFLSLQDKKFCSKLNTDGHRTLAAPAVRRPTSG